MFMLPGETVLSGCTLTTTADFRVVQSAAGWYIGTVDQDGCPCTRETEYFTGSDVAQYTLTYFNATGILLGKRT